MSDIKFLGICILAASLLVALAVSRNQNGRYQFQPSTPPGVIWKMDTATGEVTTTSG